MVYFVCYIRIVTDYADKPMSFLIKPIKRKADRQRICGEILRALPEWFGIEQAVKDYIANVQAMPMFAYFNDGKPAGFVAIRSHGRFSAEIYVMGVLAGLQGKGIGRQLVKHAERYLKDKGIRFLQVKTLSAARRCRKYERTRKFYLSLGFVPLEEFTTVWGKENPCLLLIKSIS